MEIWFPVVLAQKFGYIEFFGKMRGVVVDIRYFYFYTVNIQRIINNGLQAYCASVSIGAQLFSVHCLFHKKNARFKFTAKLFLDEAETILSPRESKSSTLRFKSLTRFPTNVPDSPPRTLYKQSAATSHSC